jgi:hypothetical protein
MKWRHLDRSVTSWRTEFNDIREGTTYTVSETPHADYDLTLEGVESGIIDGNINVRFNNSMETPGPTPSPPPTRLHQHPLAR